ncbi:hypothetical protein A9Q84_18155 [Halobacteriovorax marinus]|uniref:DUF2132 domain-containing protein n=1 Tax=Halobacteriovorax marinus TaxID=97084 RepID=A0A1Y5F3F7_9BACT|nr:hypothetical protein A9Q84_18155 [Halobacteriovorax marinus]
MNNTKSNDPLHGVTLKEMLTDLIELIGYNDLYEMTEINSFNRDHQVLKPVLRFVRKTPWAKNKIEKIYLANLEKIAKMKVQKK